MAIKVRNIRLNPCCNGRYSLRYIDAGLFELKKTVLILVVMEDTL